VSRFLYDGDALVAEYDASGNLKRRYVHGPGVDSPLLWYEGSDVSSATRRALRGDHQGTVVAVADSAGTSLAINRYDEYGIPAATNIGRFAYTGQIVIPELGMYHYKARVYDPTLGRFLQTDPVGYEADLNLYAYVGNDSVNRGDPSGLFDKSFFDPAADIDREILAFLGDKHVPGAFFVGSHGTNMGPLRSPVLDGKHDWNDWDLVKNNEILAGYPKGSGVPIILYSCFTASTGSSSESLSRAAGAVVYAAEHYGYAVKRGNKIEAFSGKDKKDPNGPRSTFQAIGNGPRPFGDAITKMVFDGPRVSVTYLVTQPGSRIQSTETTTLCTDKELCKN
jgi:RHS repeat-associated protein